MTPPHIEAIALAILLNRGFTKEEVDKTQRVNAQQWVLAVDDVTLAFNMSAEICAKAARAEARNQISNASSSYCSGGLSEYEIEEGADEVEHAIRALADSGAE